MMMMMMDLAFLPFSGGFFFSFFPEGYYLQRR